MNKNNMFNPMEIGLFQVKDFFDKSVNVPAADASLEHSHFLKNGYVHCQFVSKDPFPRSSTLVRITMKARAAFFQNTKHEVNRVEISRTGCITFVSNKTEGKSRYVAGRVCSHSFERQINDLCLDG